MSCMMLPECTRKASIRLEPTGLRFMTGRHPLCIDAMSHQCDTTSLTLASPPSSMIQVNEGSLQEEHAWIKRFRSLSSEVPNDPFAVDVFILGNLYKRNLLKVLQVHILFTPALTYESIFRFTQIFTSCFPSRMLWHGQSLNVDLQLTTHWSCSNQTDTFSFEAETTEAHLGSHEAPPSRYRIRQGCLSGEIPGCSLCVTLSIISEEVDRISLQYVSSRYYVSVCFLLWIPFLPPHLRPFKFTFLLSHLHCAINGNISYDIVRTYN